MNKKVIGIITSILILMGGYFYASPYLVLNSIKNAAQVGDSEKISAYIDYPSVRQSFKDQMNAKIMKEMPNQKNDKFSALGAMFASTIVDKMADSFISPEGMTLLIQGKGFKEKLQAHQERQANPSSDDKTKLAYSTRYLSMNVFEATLKHKDRDMDDTPRIVMERDGLSWKVKKFAFPIDNK